MPPSVKFLFQIVAGLIVALTIYKIETISLPFGTIHLGIWSIPATVLWVVAITNAINLLDGLDGLAAGTSFIKICQNTPQLCWGDEWHPYIIPSPLGGEG